MYTENFSKALNAFDDELDRLAHIARIKASEIGVATNGSPTWVIGTTTCVPGVDTCYATTTATTSSVKDEMDITKDIKQVIFNDPATIVTFADGTKVCVKACANDKFSKEVGLMYALVKRLYANDIDDNGYLKSTGLGEKLNKIIKGAVDQKELAKQKAEAKAAKKESAKKAESLPLKKGEKFTTPDGKKMVYKGNDVAEKVVKTKTKKSATKKTSTKTTDK